MTQCATVDQNNGGSKKNSVTKIIQSFNFFLQERA
jgi:hypothetical protein